jgi:hypothetical protein
MPATEPTPTPAEVARRTLEKHAERTDDRRKAVEAARRSHEKRSEKVGDLRKAHAVAEKRHAAAIADMQATSRAKDAASPDDPEQHRAAVRAHRDAVDLVEDLQARVHQAVREVDAAQKAEREAERQVVLAEVAALDEEAKRLNEELTARAELFSAEFASGINSLKAVVLRANDRARDVRDPKTNQSVPLFDQFGPIQSDRGCGWAVTPQVLVDVKVHVVGRVAQ